MTGREGSPVGARTTDLVDNKARRFSIGQGRAKVDGFVVRVNGKYFAYINRCKHMAMPLDLVENQFFTRTRKYIKCQSHGAMYLPESGKCVAGPCRGKALDPLPIRIEGEEILFAGFDDE